MSKPKHDDREGALADLLFLANPLTAAIRDRSKPKPALCLPAVAYGLQWLTSSSEFPRDARRQFTALLDTAVQFISTPMSEEQLHALELHWRVCRCDKNPVVRTLVHDEVDASPHVYDNLSHVILSLITIITGVMLQATPEKLLKSASRGKWPPSASHLLPTGPDGQVHAMVRWLRFTQRDYACQTYPFQHLTVLIRFCPSLQRSMATSDELLDCFVERLGSVVSTLEAGAPPTPWSPGPLLALQHLLMFFCTLGDYLAEQTINHELHFQRHAMVLFPTVERAQVVMTKLHKPEEFADDWERMQYALRHMSRTFWRALPKAGRPERDFSRFDKELASRSMYGLDSPFLNLLQHWIQSNACAAPSCLLTGEDVLEPLKLCQACRVLRYCSLECQREHWKWEKAPHKATCKVVGQFGAIAQPIVKSGIQGEGKTNAYLQSVSQAGYSKNDEREACHALNTLSVKKRLLQKPWLEDYP